MHGGARATKRCAQDCFWPDITIWPGWTSSPTVQCRAVETLCTLTLSDSEVLQAMQAINIYQGSCITAVLQAASPAPAPAVRLCSWRIVLWFLTL